LLTSIPSALRVFSDHHLIKILKPHSYESPTFKFAAKESCVGDYIKGLITYFNYLDKEHTIMIEPYKIEYVCNLLVAKLISKQEFDHKTKNMKKKKLIIESNLDISELESTITSIIRKCNFALIQDLQTIRNKEFKNFEGYAQGLYDKQDVALSVAIKKIDEGSKLVVKAMSDRSEKVTDILKDFNTKLDDIKSNTQLIIEYTEQIDQILDEMDNLEEYLKEHLASDFEKIKYIWKDYSLGKIERKELIGKCIKILGKKFIGLVISNLNF
jgi:predicted  nucleic acid-binding Zn-ribbon protein